MAIRISENRYGKASVKVMKIDRTNPEHRIIDMEINIILEGNLEAAFTEGDNFKVVPTDTMKNTVYILAKQQEFNSIEEFGSMLASHFLLTYDQITAAEVEIFEKAWKRMTTPSGKSLSNFIASKENTRYCNIKASQSGTTYIAAGIRDLTILKSADSGFENYVMDEYTTLQPTADRVLATTLSATWTYHGDITDYDTTFARIKSLLLERFAAHKSKSVQHTLYDMGKQVLATEDHISTIKLVMPNEHKILADLSKFEMENDNEIFVPTAEPYGVIEAELTSD